MNEPNFSRLKVIYDSKPKLALKVVAPTDEIKSKSTHSGSTSVFNKMWLTLTKFFKNKLIKTNDLTFESWQRLESKPTRHSGRK